MFRNINKVIRSYIYWDITINSGWGFLAPIFSIFLLENIAIGNVSQGAKIAGLATLFYWTTKAIIQIPIGIYLDKNHGEKDDFWFYLVGTIVVGLVPFGFIFSYLPWHIYSLQIVQAIGMSMIIPSSYAIFIRHVDRGREAYESGLDSTLLGLGAGVTGAIGGILAGYIGFELIFVLTGVFTLLSALLIFPIRKNMLPEVPRKTHKFPVGSHRKFNV